MLKRIVDVIIAAGGLVLMSPLFLLAAVAVKWSSTGPVMFRQRRVGIGGKDFQMLKFRTMRVDAPRDVATHLLVAGPTYITPVGQMLRRTSLDELPQLINVLKGDMSIVGPRPALWNQYDLIHERELRGANSVRPGLTGWAQVNGRDELSIKEKAALDGYYVEHQSLLFDLRCIISTFTTVFSGRGVLEGGPVSSTEAGTQPSIRRDDLLDTDVGSD